MDQWWRRALGPFAVLAAVVLANLPVLAGLVVSDPLGPIGVTYGSIRRGFLPGQLYTDPSVGWVSQPLGHLAAMDWLHGIVPWWNPFEGLGAPLAAGMQSGAFFPPTLLLALPNGQLFFHMVLEAAAGLATYYLVRELEMGRGVAALGGVLFALNGTFAWFGHAPDNPIPFLPVVLLGVERLARRRGFDPAGILVVAFGLALSITAGFPEIAYLDGLLVLAWFVLRLAGRPPMGRARYAASVAGGGAVGLLLAAPLLVAFLGNLPLADVGPHAGQVALAPFREGAVPVVGLPYLYGPIAAYIKNDPSALGHFWGSSGGFLTASAIALGTMGMLGSRELRRTRGGTGLRRLLAAVAILTLAWQLGLPPFSSVLDRIVPLSHVVNVFRYWSPVWEMAVVLLACFGADAVARGSVTRRAAGAAGAVTLAVIALDLILTWPVIRRLAAGNGSYHLYPVAMVAWAVVMTVAVSAAAGVPRRTGEPGTRRAHARAQGRWRSRAPSVPDQAWPGGSGPARRVAVGVIGALLALDAMAMFVLPELSAPRSVTIDTGPARFLAAHLGNGRFYSLWAYHAEVGAYFEIAAIDSNNLPVPKAWASYLHAHLATNADPLIFDGARVHSRRGPSATEELRARLSAYEAIDVRYVLALRPARVFVAERHGGFAGGVKVAYQDPRYTIFALPSPRPFFDAPSCSVASKGIEEAIVRCRAPSLLVRSELDLPGWSATLNGRPVPLSKVDGGLTGVQLRRGTNDVRFSYLPPGEGLGLAGLAAGVVAVLLLVLAVPIRRRRAGAARFGAARFGAARASAAGASTPSQPIAPSPAPVASAGSVER